MEKPPAPHAWSALAHSPRVFGPGTPGAPASTQWTHASQVACNTQVEMKMVSEFFGILETDFEIFRSDSLITVFFRKRFLSEITRFMSRNFSELCLGIFQHVIFRIACTSLVKDYLFLYFLNALRFFLG
jgi:hypothetical protein